MDENGFETAPALKRVPDENPLGHEQRAMASVKGNVLIIIAHPDDEIFVSGTMCLCRQIGFKIIVISVTDGEGGGHPLLSEPERRLRLGQIRRRELELSALTLGADEVVPLGFPDVPMESWNDANSWDRNKLVDTLAQKILDFAPALILTHGPRGGYGHPAHKQVFHCAIAAIRETQFAGSVFSFSAQVKNAFFAHFFDQPSDVLIDAREFNPRRSASLAYHQSQAGFFLTPFFPRTMRNYVSALLGIVFGFTNGGRRRIPIATPRRFFERFPIEGLAMQKAPADVRPHFFAEHFAQDERVRLISDVSRAEGHLRADRHKIFNWGVKC